ncbi:MAG: FAD-binding protein [Spirochaetaceae bacterium]|jgi:succinate dehydrogenase/fumarate reductase flavoprotein subunit|nr:FAD-binding protein [Spirochaetaceae bacterium]
MKEQKMDLEGFKANPEGTGLTRRQFLKGAAAGAAGMAAASTLGACAGGPSALSARDTGTTDWLGSAPGIKDSEIGEVIETEVLICGAGTGGLFAGAATVEKGLKTLIIEKNAVLGVVRDDVGSLNSRLQREGNSILDKEEVIQTHVMYSAGRVDERLVRIWADESGAAVDWYEELFIRQNAGKLWHEGGYDQIHQGRYKKFPTGHSPEYAEGKNGSLVLSEYILQKGGVIRFETPLVKLINNGRRVTGVIARDSQKGSYVRINASKGVIIATGGYQNNREMMQALQPDSLNLLSFSGGSVAGDGIKACLWLGAEMDDVHTSLLFDRSALLPTETTATATKSNLFWIGSQPFLKVNLNGERFFNESVPYDFSLHAASLQPGKLFISVFDSNYLEDIKRFDTVGCSRIYPYPNGAPPNIPAPVIAGMMEGLKAQGFLMEADTIPELAEKIRIPADTFSATVTRYNEIFDKQEDPDFFKEPYRLSSLRNPPYYAIRVCGLHLCTFDGIRIDSQMRPLDFEGKPFEGIYVIGDASGSFYAHTYPNLFTGQACGRTLTFGRRVARILNGEQV